MNEYVKLAIFGAIIFGVFLYLWRKGMLNRLTAYVAETKEELRKCTWPSLDELKGSTVVVMITVALLGLFTVVSDFVILKIVRNILPKL